MLPYCSHSAVSISKYSNREEVFAIKRLRIQEAISIEVDKQSSLSMQEGKSGSTKAGSTVYCTVAAIHAGVTKNSTVYPADKLQGGKIPVLHPGQPRIISLCWYIMMGIAMQSAECRKLSM